VALEEPRHAPPEVAARPPEPPPRVMALERARFEDARDLDGGPVWLVASATGLDGQCVRVVLEREVALGEWVEAGEATAMVKAGGVRAGVTPQRK
jgi:hypothetical protein